MANRFRRIFAVCFTLAWPLAQDAPQRASLPTMFGQEALMLPQVAARQQGRPVSRIAKIQQMANPMNVKPEIPASASMARLIAFLDPLNRILQTTLAESLPKDYPFLCWTTSTLAMDVLENY